jgi:hypothetical protein
MRLVEKLKKQIIKFRPWERFSEYLQTQPVPSVLKIPKWYKEIPNFINKDIEISTVNGNSNLTVKMCPPFLDALSAGYMITMPFDVYVNKNLDMFRFEWDVKEKNFIELHDNTQYPGLKIPEEFEKNAYKFNTTHIMEPPNGYSLLITHPFNRVDLPFLCLSGIVDCDRFNILPINIPFLLRKNFNGIIEKGTPIAQVIPIKREVWSHKVEPHDKNKSEFALIDLKSTIIRSYKTRWWNKKTYS